MIPDSAYVHVLIPVQLDQFQNLFLNAKALLDDNTKKVFSSKAFQDKRYYDGNTERTHEMFLRPNSNRGDADITGISVYHRLEEMLAQFSNITNMLPHVQDKDQALMNFRTKRVAPIIVAGGMLLVGLLGTFLGLY